MKTELSLLDRISQLIESGRVSLPVLNQAALRLHAMAVAGDAEVAEVERLVQSDQTLAAEVLRAANSPFFGGLAVVRTIRTAVVRLGIRQMTRLVILASERAKYRAHDPRLRQMMLELWRHASTTAFAAQWLARRLKTEQYEEECFLGGLLHDIGELLILRALDEIGSTDNELVAASPELFSEVLQAAHGQLGYNLLRQWNIPEIYCKIARDHHAPEFDTQDVPLVIVRLANEANRKLDVGLDPDSSLVLAATPEAHVLRASEILLAELEVMLEDHLARFA